MYNRIMACYFPFELYSLDDLPISVNSLAHNTSISFITFVFCQLLHLLEVCCGVVLQNIDRLLDGLPKLPFVSRFLK